MGEDYIAIYRRTGAFIRALPLIAALPLFVQILQRGLIAAELIRLSQAMEFRVAMAVPVALLMWLFVSIPLFPWYVALLTGDRSLGFRQAVAAVRPWWLRGFLLVSGAFLPLVVIGTALRVVMLMRFAGGGPGAWVLQIGMMLLVPLLILVTASAYFAIYRRVVPVGDI